MKIEVDTRQRDNQFLSRFLVLSGMVGPRKVEEQKLLMAPVLEMRVNLDEGNESTNTSRLGFDPRIEPRYLSQFSEEARRKQLEIQLSTALAELFLSEYSHDYVIDGEGKIRDKESGLCLSDLALGNPFEVKSLERIEGFFEKGAEIVVNISPENETFDYPDDMVDIWKRGEGGKLTLCRFKVEMGREQLDSFYELVGGKRGVTREEMLASPIRVDKYRFAELLTFLSLAKEKDNLNIVGIERMVGGLVDRFEREFGEKIFVDSELITRLFIALRLEVEGRKNESIKYSKKEKRDFLDEIRMQDYLYGQLRIKKVAGAGCGGSSLSGEFASQGIIIINTSDGISFRKGSTEGLTYCSKCGCWYSGDSCPICK